MASSPIPYVATTSGAASAAPHGAIPISLYGAGSGTAPAFSAIPGTVAGATGSDLQAILNALTARIVALENAGGTS